LQDGVVLQRGVSACGVARAQAALPCQARGAGSSVIGVDGAERGIGCPVISCCLLIPRHAVRLSHHIFIFTGWDFFSQDARFKMMNAD
jgi:hypothetical protein